MNLPLNPKGAAERGMRQASWLAFFFSCILVALKGFVWWITASFGAQAALLDSTLDVLGSLMAVVIIRQATKPADHHHRFGHGKLEAISSLIQSAFMAGSSLWFFGDIVKSALNRLFLSSSATPLAHGIGRLVKDVFPPNKDTVFISLVGFCKAHPLLLTNVIFGFSVLGCLALVLFQRHIIRISGSVAIKADAAHYQNDLFINVGVLLGANWSALSETPWIDKGVGAIIMIYMLMSALKIGKESIDILMDKEIDEDVRRKIRQIVTSHPEVCDLHDIRTRSTGRHIFIQFHLDLPSNISLQRAHEISDAVEASLHVEFPEADILIHQDPYGVVEARSSFL